MPETTEAQAFQQRIEALEAELAEAREQYEAERAIRLAALKESTEIRKLYAMLCFLFEGAPKDVPDTQPIPSATFDPWKQRLSPSCGKIIDALLIQPLSHQQILAFCKMNYYTARDALKTLAANKLVTKNGDVYSLRRV